MAFEELMREGIKKAGKENSSKALHVSKKTLYAYQECRGPDQTPCSNPVERMVSWLVEISKSGGLMLAMKMINLFMERSINAYEVDFRREAGGIRETGNDGGH